MKVLLRLLALIQKLIENGYEINEFGLPAPSSDDFAFYLEKQKDVTSVLA